MGIGRAIIAQAYVAADLTKTEAPAGKASDLNTAVGWLLGRNLDELPARLRPAAQELDSALQDGAITTLDIWYVHNLPESSNVQAELDQVQKTAASLIQSNYPGVEVDSITVLEVGRNRLEEWYKSSQAPILVTDEFRIPIAGGFEETGDHWQSFCTAVPADWLRALYLTHGTRVFSANVGDYLGSRRSDRNINHNIKETARGRGVLDPSPHDPASFLQPTDRRVLGGRVDAEAPEQELGHVVLGLCTRHAPRIP